MGRTIKLDQIVKIEGHAKLHVKLGKNKVEDVSLDIFEGSRFFEGILKKQKFDELPDIASRICGVCSVVHALCSIKAVENAFGIKRSKKSQELFDCLNISGMIQSHVLHLFFMILPDFYNCGNAVELAAKDKTLVNDALFLKRTANKIVEIIGGRDVHPINARVGGFSSVIDKKEIDNILPDIKKSIKLSKNYLNTFHNLDYPKLNVQTEFFSLHQKKFFSFSDKINCVGNACIPLSDYQKHFNEYFKKGSTSEFAKNKGRPYTVGALARIVNNKNVFSSESKKYVDKVLENKSNPFFNNLAQMIEIYEGFKRVLNILSKDLKFDNEKKPKPKNSEGLAALEAPRGILFHNYSFNKDGFSNFVNITTPTTQNLPQIEDAIKELLKSILDQPNKKIVLEMEKLIRSYDPCISCATHFLEVEWSKC